MDQWKPGATLKTLRHRAEFLGKIRRFFYDRKVLEVETPILARHPAIDLHLESFVVKSDENAINGYLITSPEYHMKRLLAAGSGSIYQLTKAFRCDEVGERHNPEFTILEWYREGWDHWQLMKEIDSLLMSLLSTKPADYLSYSDAFTKHLKVDPLTLTHQEFIEICFRRQVTPPADLLDETVNRNECLNYLMGLFVEPELGNEAPVFLHDYPARQANLAKIYQDRPQYAMRFEVYYKGIELGNGFCELTDAAIQRKRFQDENSAREKIGKKKLPLDKAFLNALECGMPSCAGVAMGVDRMLMLALGLNQLDKVVSFSWPRA